MFTENILTEHLTISCLSKEDSCFIYELVNSPGWQKFIGDRNVRTVDDAEVYVNNLLSKANINYWVVKLTRTGDRMGVVTCIKKDYLEHHDIGFAFLPEFEGKGYAFEATRVVMEELKTYKGYETLLACTLPENDKSINLLERLGLNFSGNIKVEKENLLLYINR